MLKKVMLTLVLSSILLTGMVQANTSLEWCFQECYEEYVACVFNCIGSPAPVLCNSACDQAYGLCIEICRFHYE